MIEGNETTNGRLRRVGPPSVQVTTLCNVDVRVPNSKCLEKNVINWTLENDIIKSDVAVRLDFDALPTEVVELMRRTAIEHREVLDDPPPHVYLEDLNSDADYPLFKVSDWLRVPSPEQRLRAASELHIKIIATLRQHGTELASPTQDVMLHKAGETSSLT